MKANYDNPDEIIKGGSPLFHVVMLPIISGLGDLRPQPLIPLRSPAPSPRACWNITGHLEQGFGAGINTPLLHNKLGQT